MNETMTYSRKEAAKKLGVSVVTIDRLLANRNIAHFRVGKRVLFTDKHIEDYISDNERNTKATMREQSKRL